MSIDDELEDIKKRMLEKMMKPHDSGLWTNGIILELDDNNFQEVLSLARLPVIVDFWAHWCSPCHMMKPVFEAMARKYAGHINFAKIDVDKNQRTAQKYGIMSIPNFVVFKRGKPVERVVGAVGRAGLERILSKFVS